MNAPPYETCMAMRKGASHPLDPSPCMGCPSCKRNQYRRALETERHRQALLDLRSDMREPAEREGGLMRHFYDRICATLNCEESAKIMRNPERTGGWAGANRVARQFDRIAARAALQEGNGDE